MDGVGSEKFLEEGRVVFKMWLEWGGGGVG